MIEQVLLPLRQGDLSLAQVTNLLTSPRGKEIETVGELATYLKRVRRAQLLRFVVAVEKERKKGSEPSRYQLPDRDEEEGNDRGF